MREIRTPSICKWYKPSLCVCMCMCVCVCVCPCMCVSCVCAQACTIHAHVYFVKTVREIRTYITASGTSPVCVCACACACACVSMYVCVMCVCTGVYNSCTCILCENSVRNKNLYHCKWYKPSLFVCVFVCVHVCVCHVCVHRHVQVYFVKTV